MGFIAFKPSRRPSGSWEVEDMTPHGSATLAIGEPVQRNSSDPELIEPFAGGATVTGLLGFSGAVVTSGVPNYRTKITVYKANLDTEFIGQIWDVSEGVVATVAAATHEGNQYGIVEPTAGEWYIDEEDTSDVVVTVTRVLDEINAALFKVISSAIGV